MTTLAASESHWAAAPGRIGFALLWAFRLARRKLKRRRGARLDELPDYLLADIGLSRVQAEMAETWGRIRP